MTLDEDMAGKQIFLEFSNDDDAVFYVNGVEVHNTGSTCNKNAMVKLPEAVVATLRKGENLIAAECRNPDGNGLLGLRPADPERDADGARKDRRADLRRRAGHADALCLHVRGSQPGTDLLGAVVPRRPCADAAARSTT